MKTAGSFTRIKKYLRMEFSLSAICEMKFCRENPHSSSTENQNIIVILKNVTLPQEVYVSLELTNTGTVITIMIIMLIKKNQITKKMLTNYFKC